MTAYLEENALGSILFNKNPENFLLQIKTKRAVIILWNYSLSENTQLHYLNFTDKFVYFCFAWRNMLNYRCYLSKIRKHVHNSIVIVKSRF